MSHRVFSAASLPSVADAGRCCYILLPPPLLLRIKLMLVCHSYRNIQVQPRYCSASPTILFVIARDLVRHRPRFRLSSLSRTKKSARILFSAAVSLVPSSAAASFAPILPRSRSASPSRSHSLQLPKHSRSSSLQPLSPSSPLQPLSRSPPLPLWSRSSSLPRSRLLQVTHATVMFFPSSASVSFVPAIAILFVIATATHCLPHSYSSLTPLFRLFLYRHCLNESIVQPISRIATDRRNRT